MFQDFCCCCLLSLYMPVLVENAYNIRYCCVQKVVQQAYHFTYNCTAQLIFSSLVDSTTD